MGSDHREDDVRLPLGDWQRIDGVGPNGDMRAMLRKVIVAERNQTSNHGKVLWTLD